MTHDTETGPRLREQIAELESNPNLFRQLLNASGVAMAVRNAELKPLLFNRAFSDFLGYSREEVLNSPPGHILPDETRRLYQEQVMPLLRAGESWEGEYVIRSKGGRRWPVWGRFDPVVDESGKLTHVISVMRDVSEARRLRNALDHVERHLRFLAENISDCLFRLRLTDGRYDYISPAVSAITGFSVQEFYDTPRFLRYLAPEDWRSVLELWWDEYLAGTVRAEYDFPIIDATGATKWLNQRVSLVRDCDKKPIAIEGVLTDITARHEAESELATARESLNFIRNSTSDIFFRMRVPEGTYDYLSPSVERVTGYTLQEYRDTPLLARDIMQEDWREYFEECWKEILRGEIRPAYEFQCVHKSGEVRWMHQRIILVTDEDGAPVAIEGLVSDVTSQKLAEEAIRESERKYRLLAENITDVVWTQDNDLTFTYVTPSVRHLWGYTQEEMGRLPDRALFTPGSMRLVADLRAQRRALEERGQYDVTHRTELELVRKDGSVAWAEVVVSRLLGRDGRPIGYLGVARDISARKKAETALQWSERRFRDLFEDSPISLWEEDLTRLKFFFEELKASGVADFREHFASHPEDLAKCATLVDVVDVNRATLEMLGASGRDELLGNLDRVLTESSMAAFAEEMVLLASGGHEYRGEITHRTFHGDIIWVAVHFAVPPEYRETLSRVIVSLIDVTPRKRAEQALKESEGRYRALVENAREGVIVSRDAEPLFINEATTHILGYTLEELASRDPLELVLPEDRHLIRDFGDGPPVSPRFRRTVTCRVRTRDGGVKWVAVGVKSILWGGREAELAILTDITAHKSLEAELRAIHARMEERIVLRTAELSRANLKLKEEVAEREKAQEQILSLTKDIIRVQEAERQRIARDLHDNVAQDLSSIVLKLKTLFDGHDGVDAELFQRGESAARVVKKTVADVRSIAYGLRPPALDQLGLVRALENYCQEVARRTGLFIDFFSAGMESGTLESDAEINVYRMLQESINNVVKHADATKVTVRAVKSHPDIILRIEDNGRGFDLETRLPEAARENRMGVRSMEERARLNGGTMEIQSLPGKGTRVVFTIPLERDRRQ
ncbi:PAS domain S-box protein [Pseudodesulfovibrio sp.]|uniref:PAS domain-containing sensor histidine kinase n=1 Tax=Pseudodesulfovibrio sp. TaxID=2035812 RepID=UPI00261F88C8|nr:PAS domain S-box protein [Pseudodesulfovibrio sp.]MDD3313655.1 PAS domain S-box protein [Pseudodesulfovibrio sp.]